MPKRNREFGKFISHGNRGIVTFFAAAKVLHWFLAREMVQLQQSVRRRKAACFCSHWFAAFLALPTWRTTTLVFLWARNFRATLVSRNCVVGMRLYVGNLSYDVTSQSLETLFGEFGQVKSAQVVQDRDTGRSKGFGFVEMNDNGQAQAAIAGLNLKEIEGRCLTVNEARPREERGGGSRGYGGGGRRY
jgi:cold-inducible RNA-binding protein